MVVHHRLLHEIFAVPMHRSHDETVTTYVDLFLSGLLLRSSGTRSRRGRRP
jgi:hypothetical protein